MQFLDLIYRELWNAMSNAYNLHTFEIRHHFACTNFDYGWLK